MSQTTIAPERIPAPGETCPANSVRLSGVASDGEGCGIDTPGPENASGTHPATSLPATNAKRPDHTILRETMHRLELAWLADKSTAPDDEMSAEMVRIMEMTPETVAHVLSGRDPRFLAALLLRGISRLWTAGPSVTPQRL